MSFFRILSCLVASTFLTLAVSTGAAAAPTQDAEATATALPAELDGIWEGTLDVGAMKLRLVFRISIEESGRVTATIDSPDQGAFGLPVDEVTFEEGRVKLAMRALAASYEGKPDTEWTQLSGRFTQAGHAIRLDLAHVEAPSERARPQTPEPPFPYEEQEVEYRNDADDITIAGTLTLPEGEAAVPAVLLVTGSGAQDRDETIFDHKPFAVIADYLTRRGIAVLRVDDRGIGGTSPGDPAATSVDLSRDVEAGVDFLLGHTRVRDDAIGILGHSEGGMIGPMVAARRDDVAFLVMLAGPGMPCGDLLVEQSSLLMRAGGAPEEAVAQNVKTQRALFALMNDDSLDTAELHAKAREVLQADTNMPIDPTARKTTLDAQLRQVTSPWFRYFVRYDPAPVLEKVTCPVLALNGELDLQVPCNANLAGIATALRKAGNTDFQALALPKLNHLFQECEVGTVAEYAQIETTIEERVLEKIATWITDRTKVASAGAAKGE